MSSLVKLFTENCHQEAPENQESESMSVGSNPSHQCWNDRDAQQAQEHNKIISVSGLRAGFYLLHT